jgi:hypothetical protein
MGRATLGSVAIHTLVALAIPALAWTVSTETPVETISFAHVLHVVVTPPRAPAPPPRAQAPHHAPKAALTFVSHVPVARSVPRLHASAQPPAATFAPAAPAVSSLAQAGTGSAASAGVPQATASPEARTVASLGSRRAGGYLPFGAEQPEPVLDPNVRKSLDGLGVHVTLVIVVGDDGRTQSVAFEPPIDPQLETKIRSLLADASWDPAVCGGGVACQGRATISL